MNDTDYYDVETTVVDELIELMLDNELCPLSYENEDCPSATGISCYDCWHTYITGE